MTAVWSFLRQYLTEDEAWMLLPVLAAVCVAIGSFFFLQSVIDKRSTVTDAEKADWKQKLADEGKKVIERAKQKAAEDTAAIKAKLQHTHTHSDKQKKRKSKGVNSTQPHTEHDTSAATTTDELRQRKNKTPPTHSDNTTADSSTQQQQQQSLSSPADDSGMASDNDWELVDDERIERAEESLYQPPEHYEQAVNAFVEALHELPQSAVDELHAAVRDFFSVLCGLLDGSSHVTPLPSTRADSAASTATAQPSPALSPSDRYATRNVLLSHIVDTQSLHALHAVIDAHPGTSLAADAAHLHALLVPLLHSH